MFPRRNPRPTRSTLPLGGVAELPTQGRRCGRCPGRRGWHGSKESCRTLVDSTPAYRAVASGSRAPHLKSVPPFHVWPPVAACIQYCIYKRGPLLRHPSDGPAHLVGRNRAC